MFAILSLSGPFGILSVAIAATGLVFALAEAATGGRRTFRRAVALAAAVAVLIGAAGTAAGLHVAATALGNAPDTFSPDQLATMWRAGVGVASTTTAIGCLGAVVDLLALGALFGLESRRRCADGT